MKRRFTILLGVFVVAGAAYAVSAPSWFRPLVALRHPEVEWITTEELAELLDEGEVTLLDVRESAEFAESRIPGSRFGGEAIPTDLEGEVVVYCSLGVRSADRAEGLRRRGVRVRNLEGGIFAWANEDRALENDDGATTRVHPYNTFFGRYVDEEHRAAGP